LFVVKDNQSELLDNTKMAFEPYWWLKGSLLKGYSDWPGL
jgi:hypothetical protein